MAIWRCNMDVLLASVRMPLAYSTLWTTDYFDCFTGHDEGCCKFDNDFCFSF